MPTSELIDRLVADLKPVPATAVIRRLGAGLLPGIVASAGLMQATLGIRPDLAGAAASPVFWAKVVYAAILTSLAVWAVMKLARPGGTARAAAVAAPVTFLVLAVLAVVQFGNAVEAERTPLVVGTTALVCPWLIVMLSAPVFVGTFWALGGLAPTRPGLAGAAAGLFSGAAGALIYSLHCPESGLPFVAIWYTAGILIAGTAGAVLGPRLLRW